MFLIPQFIFFAFLLIIISTQRSDYNEKDFINWDVKRQIELDRQIIHIKNTIHIKNQKVDPIYTYRYLLSSNTTNSWINLSVKMSSPTNRNDLIENIKISKIKEDSEFIYYDISFRNDPMNYEEERLLIITEDYFDKIEFLPKKLQVKDDQYALYTDTINLISAYTTLEGTTIVILPSERTSLVKYTMKGSTKSENKIKYNVKKIAPFGYEHLYLHYEDNRPYTVMNYANITYELSHWGNIAVYETYQLENIGGILDGEFGRVDYDDYGKYGGKNAWRYLEAHLPIRSWGWWYRDEIGNVSTSNAMREWDDVKMILFPRFPILGGWKDNFDIGYNLPSKFHVKTNEEGNYVLNITFGMPFSDIMARNYKIKIVLPEGADDIKVHLPIDGKYELISEEYKGFLDWIGRKSVVISMNNAYDIHKIYFQIYYSYSSWKWLTKPCILITYFFLIFLGLVLYFRANLSLSKKDSVSDIKEKTD